MDFWLPIMDEDPAQTVEIARLAEAAGYTGIALADHITIPVAYESLHPSGEQLLRHTTGFIDPLVSAATILACTETIRVMTYVYILPLREPFSVAKQVGTLAILSGGRFRLGVGAGWLLEEIATLGHPVRGRGRRMDEMLEIIPRFWTEEAVEFHGEFFDFAPTGMAPRPPGPVPIWVGGKSPAALARAARHDGWLGMNYELPEVHRLLDALARARSEEEARTGRKRDDFETFVIPIAPPSQQLFADLAGRGVTSTLGAPWGFGDKRFASLEAKRDAIAAFADAFLRP